MTFSRTVTFEPTLEELADAFSNLGSIEQAKFFELVAKQFNSWGDHERNLQALYVFQDLNGSHEAKSLLLDFAAYGAGEE